MAIVGDNAMHKPWDEPTGEAGGAQSVRAQLEAHKVRGEAFLEANNPGAALGEAEKMLALDPGSQDALALMVMGTAAKGDYKGAYALALRQIEAAPDEPTGHANAAQLAMRLRLPQPVIEEHLAGVRETDVLSYHTQRLAMLNQFKAGGFIAAEQMCQALTRRFPEAARNHACHHAIALIMQDRLDEAEALLDGWLAQGPDDDELATMALLEFHRYRFDKAYDFAVAALEMDPTSQLAVGIAKRAQSFASVLLKPFWPVNRWLLEAAAYPKHTDLSVMGIVGMFLPLAMLSEVADRSSPLAMAIYALLAVTGYFLLASLYVTMTNLVTDWRVGRMNRTLASF